MIASLTDDPFRRIPLAAVLLAELFALDGQLEEAMKAVASYRNTDLEWYPPKLELCESIIYSIVFIV